MTLSIKFYSQPVYDGEYIKTKVKLFNKVVNTVFQTMKFQKKEIITLVLE